MRCTSVTPPEGGEVVRLTSRATIGGQVAKAVLISAVVPPVMVKTPGNPGGLPKEVFDGFPGGRSPPIGRKFYRDSARGSLLRLSTGPGVKPVESIIQNWWRSGNDWAARRAHYDGIVAFSQTDFTEEMKKITIPVLVMHGDDDQVVPYADCRAAVGEAAQEFNTQDVQGVPPRDADHGRRRRSTPTCWAFIRG